VKLASPFLGINSTQSQAGSPNLYRNWSEMINDVSKAEEIARGNKWLKNEE